MQSRIGSLFESAANIVIGFCVALISQLLVFPLFGIDIPFSSNLGISAWFTAISLVRSYVIRRWFNARIQAAARAVSDFADQEKAA